LSQTELAHPRENALFLRKLIKEDLAAGFGADVRRGLQAESKYLLPKYFYDRLGSQLFDAICLLPEYYLTRAETEILGRYADDIIRSVNGPTTLIEMGSGSALKTKLVIEALLRRQHELLFIPVDISASALEKSSVGLLQTYPRLRIEAYAADYSDGLSHLREKKRGHTLALFLGSNIGNSDPSGALEFLHALRRVLQPGDALLLGADLKKDRHLLEAAYDDPLGVTAAFNLNLLARINRELGGNFALQEFRHRAIYNEEVSRMEMFLESRRAQTVRVTSLGLEVRFSDGERIHTENSYKYSLTDISRLAADCGYAHARTWLDDHKRFSSNLLLATDKLTQPR
jgi:L-histidine Nalpha-methyltransferase